VLDPLVILIEFYFLCSALGLLVLANMTSAGFTPRYSRNSRLLLLYGTRWGLAGVLFTALIFQVIPDISSPGFRNLLVLATGFTAFCVVGCAYTALRISFSSGLIGRDAAISPSADTLVGTSGLLRLLAVVAGVGIILHGMSGVIGGEGQLTPVAIVAGVLIVCWGLVEAH
jgi:hypothetical protein